MQKMKKSRNRDLAVRARSIPNATTNKSSAGHASVHGSPREGDEGDQGEIGGYMYHFASN